MRVYRIQHQDRGHGPYIIPFFEGDYDDPCDNLYDDLSTLAYMLIRDHQDDLHKAPDIIPSRKICGFDSMYALEAWFDGYLTDLFEAGYVVAEFEGVDVREHGNGQVTFDKELSFRLTSITN
jgi:hypothetical protein